MVQRAEGMVKDTFYRNFRRVHPFDLTIDAMCSLPSLRVPIVFQWSDFKGYHAFASPCIVGHGFVDYLNPVGCHFWGAHKMDSPVKPQKHKEVSPLKPQKAAARGGLTQRHPQFFSDRSAEIELPSPSNLATLGSASGLWFASATGGNSELAALEKASKGRPS